VRRDARAARVKTRDKALTSAVFASGCCNGSPLGESS